ncbi:hypothetical protein DFH29DRAFT_263315 [Suillus ampliporus]|nr:hypothetical protein DFH29DRAFT_263315 [Suillus ampliporus]
MKPCCKAPMLPIIITLCIPPAFSLAPPTVIISRQCVHHTSFHNLLSEDNDVIHPIRSHLPHRLLIDVFLTAQITTNYLFFTPNLSHVAIKQDQTPPPKHSGFSASSNMPNQCGHSPDDLVLSAYPSGELDGSLPSVLVARNIPPTHSPPSFFYPEF